MKETDEEHPATIDDIRIALYGSLADSPDCRKSILRDLSILGLASEEDDEDAPDSMGMHIVRTHIGHSAAFYIQQRDFSPQEVQLLCDIVQTANFVTAEESYALIHKLGNLASCHQAKTMLRDVRVKDRAKSSNADIFSNLSVLQQAIQKQIPVRFQYLQYNLRKQREPKTNASGGVRKYTVTPGYLVWMDQNYYLIGYYHATEEIRTYRIDRMNHLVPLLRDSPKGLKQLREKNTGDYSKQVFHMFEGNRVRIKLRLHISLLDAAIDRFGEDVLLIPDGTEHFTLEEAVDVSRQFFGWLAGFGTKAEILSPPDIRQALCSFMENILGTYGQ